MVNHMRHTRAHTRNRRSHHALVAPAFSSCEHCKAAHLRHRACTNCGMYRGRQVLDVAAVRERAAKRKEAKLKAIGKEASSEGKKENEPKSETK